MSEVIKTVDVDVDVRTAYNQWTQFEEFPRFMEGVEQVEQLDDRHLRWHVDIAGIDREFEAEITEQTPDQRIAWRSRSGVDQGGVVTFHALDDEHTRVTLQSSIPRVSSSRSATRLVRSVPAPREIWSDSNNSSRTAGLRPALGGERSTEARTARRHHAIGGIDHVRSEEVL